MPLIFEILESLFKSKKCKFLLYNIAIIFYFKRSNKTSPSSRNTCVNVLKNKTNLLIGKTFRIGGGKKGIANYCFFYIMLYFILYQKISKYFCIYSLIRICKLVLYVYVDSNLNRYQFALCLT